MQGLKKYLSNGELYTCHFKYFWAFNYIYFQRGDLSQPLLDPHSLCFPSEKHVIKDGTPKHHHNNLGNSKTGLAIFMWTSPSCTLRCGLSHWLLCLNWLLSNLFPDHWSSVHFLYDVIVTITFLVCFLHRLKIQWRMLWWSSAHYCVFN